MSKQCSNQLSYPPEQGHIITKPVGNGNPCGIIAPVTKPKRPEDLSVDELRRLLLEKRRVSRQQRLDRFRRTGRAVTLAPDLPPAALDEWRTGSPNAEEGGQAKGPEGEAPPRSRRWMDRVLLAVEVLAILGLVGVLFNGMGILQTLNDEVAAALQQPTLSPTPLITAVVLPGGHTPPDAAGGPQPNEAEIPEHLRPLVQSLANLPVPTPGPEQAVRIQIPAIGVDAPVVQGDGWDQLKKGVGQHIGSANPGQVGNVVLSGHDDVFGEIFRYLENLQPGDLVFVYTSQRQFVYVVTGSQIVPPTQVDVMNPTSDATLTLITCYPYRIDNKRFIVFAKLQTP
jgi:sortase A